jgi:hypothetical protein
LQDFSKRLTIKFFPVRPLLEINGLYIVLFLPISIVRNASENDSRVPGKESQVSQRPTRFILAAVLAAICLFGTKVMANTISTLYNTGAGVTSGNVDPHYTLASSPSGSGYNGTVYTLPQGTWPLGSAWSGDDSTSSWDVPSVPSTVGKQYLWSNAVGNYTYQTTFSMAGFNPGSADISGQFESDNALLDIYLNGHALYSSTTGEGAMKSWTTFSLLDPYLIAGTNTLQFVVNNASDGPANWGNPTGLRVQFTTRSATPDPVPEPGTLVLCILGLAGLAGYRAKKPA